MKYFSTLFLFWIFLSCSQKQDKSDSVASVDMLSGIDTVEAKVIQVVLSDTAYSHVEQTFEQVSYVVLSNDVLIGEVVRTLVADERIFILDDRNKIVCYNMKGNVEYVIDDYGPGPDEYGTILDFALNTPLRLLWMYDSSKRYLLAYDMYTGKRRQSLPAAYMAPSRMAIWEGAFFFHTPNHYNYANQPEMHYSLLYSVLGSQIDKRFFPHDGTSELRFSYGEEHPFYYNGDHLYYINTYGNTIYKLTTKSISPLYKVNLPDSLPLDILIEQKPSLELMQSRYSWLLTNAYEVDGLLNLWFQKQGYYYTVFYDLQKDKLVYAGKRVDNIPVEELLFFFPIKGVYKDLFFSLVPSFVILNKIDRNPGVFPDNLKKLTEEDNPVVAFYKVKKS